MRVRTKRLAAVYAVCLGGLLAVVIVPTAMRVLGDGDSGASVRPQIASPAPVDPAAEQETAAPSPLSAPPKASASATTISTGYSSTGIVRPIQPPSSSGPAATVPGTVRNLHVVRADRTQLVVGWSAATRATSYLVYVNGYASAKVTGTSASLRWSGDGADHYVEVVAVNSTGQVSKAVAFLQVVRPAAPTEADPTTEPSSPATTKEPTIKPTKSTPPTKPTQPTKGPTAGPTADPDPTQPTKEPMPDPTKPTREPSQPSEEPSRTPSEEPSQPSEEPTRTPSEQPSEKPSDEPSDTPSASADPSEGNGGGRGRNGVVGDVTGLFGIGSS